MNVSLQIKNIEAIKRAIEQKADKVLRNCAAEIGTTALAIQKDAKLKAPSDTGMTRAKIQVASFQQGLVSEVYVAQESAIFIEKGTGPAVGNPPFMPPSDALAGWCKRHGLAGKEFIIARAIGRRGLKPRPFFYPAAEHHLANFPERMEKAIQDGFNG